MNYGLRDKIVVISGGTSGIGLATAQLALADGAKVFLIGRSEENGLSALGMLGADPERVKFIQADIATVDGCQVVAEAVRSFAGRADILVNSAGVYREQWLELVTEKEYQEIMDINVKGTLFLCQVMIPLMTEHGSAIINIASDAGLEGNYGCPVYCASKGAVVALTRALALDYAPRIRVNCICPGDVATPLVEKQLAAGDYTLEEMAEPYPIGRIGLPEEIAHVICSMASPFNSYMTGSIVAVDGGLTAK
ncbi:MAG: SDR family NAD(P)-dependent oxidoreductase [Acidaminococcaceae bacterium]